MAVRVDRISEPNRVMIATVVSKVAITKPMA